MKKVNVKSEITKMVFSITKSQYYLNFNEMGFEDELNKELYEQEKKKDEETLKQKLHATILFLLQSIRLSLFIRQQESAFVFSHSLAQWTSVHVE